MITKSNEKYLKIKKMVMTILPDSVDNTGSWITSKIVTCLTVLSKSGGEKTSGISKFNENVDQIKTQTNWKEILTGEIKGLNTLQIDSLIAIPAKDLRGLDREFIHTLYTAIDEHHHEKLDKAQIDKLKVFIENYKTLVLDDISEKNMRCIGGGAVNKVYEVKYQDDNGIECIGIFKPDLEKMPVTLRFKESQFGAAAAAGIPTGNKSYFSDRSVLSSKLDELLYGENRVSVKTEFAIVNGQRGIMMEKATPGKINYTKININQPISVSSNETQFINAELERLEKNGKLDEKAFERTLNVIGSIHGCRNVQIKFDRNAKDGQPLSQIQWTLVGDFPEYEGSHFDPNNHKLAAALDKIHWLDLISGQTDRHPHNYNNHEDGAICFDNDCSFGINSMPKDIDEIRNQPSFAHIVPNNSSMMLNPPNVITQEVRDQIIDIHDNKMEELIAILRLHLDENEVQATLLRLDSIYIRLNADSSRLLVVKNDEELLSDEARKRRDVNNSYLERDRNLFDPSIQGWNYLRRRQPIPAYTPPN